MVALPVPEVDTTVTHDAVVDAVHPHPDELAASANVSPLAAALPGVDDVGLRVNEHDCPRKAPPVTNSNKAAVRTWVTDTKRRFMLATQTSQSG